MALWLEGDPCLETPACCQGAYGLAPPWTPDHKPQGAESFRFAANCTSLDSKDLSPRKRAFLSMGPVSNGDRTGISGSGRTHTVSSLLISPRVQGRG